MDVKNLSWEQIKELAEIAGWFLGIIPQSY